VKFFSPELRIRDHGLRILTNSNSRALAGRFIPRHKKKTPPYFSTAERSIFAVFSDLGGDVPSAPSPFSRKSRPGALRVHLSLDARCSAALAVATALWMKSVHGWHEALNDSFRKGKAGEIYVRPLLLPL
jgi:hypothetical protein